jgi:hypothetical protein
MCFLSLLPTSFQGSFAWKIGQVDRTLSPAGRNKVNGRPCRGCSVSGFLNKTHHYRPQMRAVLVVGRQLMSEMSPDPYVSLP